MKRHLLDLETVAAYQNLAEAAYRAGRGKRHRPEVITFFADFDQNLAALRTDLLTGRAPYGRYRSFTIHDPKERIIHAACFADRVLHHALMIHLGPLLERALIDQTYACRPDKGPLAAVHQAQRNCQRYPWYVKIDVSKYFDSIDHEVLLAQLLNKFKGEQSAQLLQRIIVSYHTTEGQGLPIGALTSQHFANYYLDPLDRFLQESCRVSGYVRYMDDMAWWVEDRDTAKKQVALVRDFLETKLKLRIKDNVQINRSASGVPLCGFRVLPGTLRLSHRRRGRYQERKMFWETAYCRGVLPALRLQQAYAGVFAITAHADSRAWRRRANGWGLEVDA
jgi:RNA-directed DNA polymerase